MQHTAINPTHQRAIERLYKADRKLCALIDSNQRKMDDLDPYSEKGWRVQERCELKEAEMHGDFVERYIDEAELPKREIEAFTKSYVAFHGYTPYLV